MGEHAKLLQPSSAERWTQCAVSAVREAALPPEPSGEAAIDGTHTHSLLEMMLGLNNISPGEPRLAHEKAGTYGQDHEGEYFCDDDRCNRVQVALDYILPRAAELGATILSEVMVNPGALINLSPEVWKGTCDVLLEGNNTLEIIDYKDGRWEVFPEDNAQLISYAAEAFMRLPGGKRSGELYAYSAVVLTIIQPKTSPAVRSTRYSAEAFEVLVGELSAAAGAAVAAVPEDPGNPGDWCKFCRAKLTCPEYVAQTEVALSAVLPADMQVSFDPMNMTDVQVEEALDKAPLIKELLNSIEAEALRRASSGTVFDTFKAIHTPTRKGWSKSGEEMLGELGKGKGRLTQAQYVKKAVMTPKQVLAHDLSDAQRARVDRYLKQSEPQLKLVPRSAKGEEVFFDAEHALSDLDLSQIPQAADIPAPTSFL